MLLESVSRDLRVHQVLGDRKDHLDLQARDLSSQDPQESQVLKDPPEEMVPVEVPENPDLGALQEKPVSPPLTALPIVVFLISWLLQLPPQSSRKPENLHTNPLNNKKCLLLSNKKDINPFKH